MAPSLGHVDAGFFSMGDRKIIKERFKMHVNLREYRTKERYRKISTEVKQTF
jgi:hypothetical protein